MNKRRSLILISIVVAGLLSSGEATCRIIPVPGGGDFQAALDEAQSGDIITLEAGATFTGPFVLPVKAGSGWIGVRTSAPDSSLPMAGRRIDPSYAPRLPKLAAPNSLPALQAAARAHHYWFRGVEILPVAGAFTFNLVELGASETSLTDLPHHLIFDQCYIHGDPLRGSRRGIALNSSWTTVIDSYLSDFKDTDSDSQAIAGWNGSGPFTIANNYLEAAGDNILFGGADPRIPGLVPSDIQIVHNHFFKPLSWRIGDPAYGGTPWRVKNILELKNARRVLITGNILEHNWVHAQNGFAVLFTVRNQDGTAPWSVVEDVIFVRNILRQSASGFNFLGSDNNFPSEPTRRVLIRDNLLLDISGVGWGTAGDGRLFQFVGPTGLTGPVDITIEHNTGFQSGPIMVADGSQSPGLVYRNNIIPEGTGFLGSGTAPGLDTLRTYFPDAIYVRNVQPGGNPLLYPEDNFFPPALADVGFVDLDGGDYRLRSDSPYKNAGSDGKDPGADIDAVLSATNGAESGLARLQNRVDVAQAILPAPRDCDDDSTQCATRPLVLDTSADDLIASTLKSCCSAKILKMCWPAERVIPLLPTH